MSRPHPDLSVKLIEGKTLPQARRLLKKEFGCTRGEQSRVISLARRAGKILEAKPK